VDVAHINELLEIVGDVGAQIIAPRLQLSGGQFAFADVIEQQRLDAVELGSVQTVGEVSGDDVKGLNKALVRLERFWSDQIRYRL
jgi:hypothetical protein